MPSAWSPTQLNQFAHADELDVTSHRTDGLCAVTAPSGWPRSQTRSSSAPHTTQATRGSVAHCAPGTDASKSLAPSMM